MARAEKRATSLREAFKLGLLSLKNERLGEVLAGHSGQ
jgi:hypothetical protein